MTDLFRHCAAAIAAVLMTTATIVPVITAPSAQASYGAMLPTAA